MEENRIDASPAKRFFVDMLTRDIELKDAILDLIDNCLDGAMREVKNKGYNSKENVYSGYHAYITMDANQFTIEDNCGGIPEKIAKEQAFRMGKPTSGDQEELPTIGVYGIGMKRAIFKMGKIATITTKTEDSEYRVNINPAWLDDDLNWTLELEPITDVLPQTGTSIKISALRDGIAKLVSDKIVFQADLINEISNHFSIILGKGFEIKINDIIVKPNATLLLFNENAFTDENGITPFVYENHKDGVSINLAVGFYRGLSSDEEDELYLEGRNSSEKAGWTIICNDRVVIYADKTRLTGWGEASVPHYHTQFIGIAGVVRFTSNDAKKLPVTTTKRGIDGNSELYLAVKDHMREGLKTFTTFTNKWKTFGSNKEKVKEFSNSSINASSEKLLELIPDDKWKNSNKEFGGRYFRPNLPIPKEDDPTRQIKFNAKLRDIKIVAAHIFDNEDAPVSDVGKACFDYILKEANENE